MSHWLKRTVVNNSWMSLTYGNGLFVAVASSGTGNRVMTSPDGITWTARTSAADNYWVSVTYGNGLFVAVASTGISNRVMTSSNGIDWIIRTSAADNSWKSVTYGNGLFVAVAYDGTYRVMTSPDGINWTLRLAAQNNFWYNICYGNNLFVAVAYDGTNRVMTSPDGINWTARVSPQAGCTSVCYGNGTFLAVAYDGANSVMTSPDGTVWSKITTSVIANMRGITFANNRFVVVADNGVNRVMTFLTIAQMLSGGITISQILSSSVVFDKLGQDIDGEATSDESGRSVSLSSDGTTVAIGANYNDGSASNAGHVRVYKYTSGTWTQLGGDIDGEAAGDWSGFSVSLSSDGTTVAIGAYLNDGTSGTDRGHVRVYKYTGGTWTKLGQDIDGEAVNDQSGFSVSLSSDGTTVAIGANTNNGTSGTDRGHVRVYKYTSGTWTQLGLDIDGEAANDQSGFSVSLSSDGTTVAIGAHLNDGTGINAGHVRVYKYTSGTWTQLGLDINGEAAGDNLGRSVSLSSDGTTVAIGAHLNDGTAVNAGHVRVYTYINNVWTKLGLDIDGEVADDQSGISVSLSSDGTTVAISAHLNDGTGISAGHVRVYKYTSETWTQLGLDIDGEAENDTSGRSVSLSSDGTTVAIGANFNDGTIGTDRGHVRVYKIFSASYVPYGVDLDKLKAAGYLATDLKVAGYTATDLKVAGYTATDLEVAGYLQSDITTAGYTQTTAPSLTFSNISKTFGDDAFIVTTPTSNSTGSFSYTISDTSVATISGTIVTIVGAGTTTITATQAETTNYNSGTTTCTLTVSKTDASILFGAGYTATYLKAGGYTAIQLEMGGYALTDINNLNYTNAEVETRGELIYALNTSSQNKPIVLTGDIDLRQVPSNLYSNSVKQISASKEIKIYF